MSTYTIKIEGDGLLVERVIDDEAALKVLDLAVSTGTFKPSPPPETPTQRLTRSVAAKAAPVRKRKAPAPRGSTAAVLAILRNRTKPTKTATICERAYGFSEPAIYSALGRLCRSGLIAKTGRALYVITEHGRGALV